MDIFLQLGIIFGICWFSQFIEQLLPFSFPATVIGLILSFLALLFRFVKIKNIEKVSTFLQSNMAIFFVPAGVNILNYFSVLAENLVPLIVICVLSTIITFAVTAYSIRITLYLMNRRKKE